MAAGRGEFEPEPATPLSQAFLGYVAKVLPAGFQPGTVLSLDTLKKIQHCMNSAS